MERKVMLRAFHHRVIDADIRTADASFHGANAYDRAGYAMASARDLNKDDNDDFLISVAYFGSASTGKA